MSSEQDFVSKLSNPSNWKKTHKKAYEVYVCRPEFGTQCHNYLEDAEYTTNENKQFILSGTRGETWVIDGNKLAKTYTFEDGSPINAETLKRHLRDDGQLEWTKLKTREDAGVNFAILLPKSIKNFPVKTSWGDTLLANRDEIKHGLGDFLVCAATPDGQPNLNDVWVVNGEVFPMTYDLRAFPNMFPARVLSATTVKPIENFTTIRIKDLDRVVNGELHQFTAYAGHHGLTITDSNIKATSENSFRIKSNHSVLGPCEIYLSLEKKDYCADLCLRDPESKTPADWCTNQVININGCRTVVDLCEKYFDEIDDYIEAKGKAPLGSVCANIFRKNYGPKLDKFDLTLVKIDTDKDRVYGAKQGFWAELRYSDGSFDFDLVREGAAEIGQAYSVSDLRDKATMRAIFKNLALWCNKGKSIG